MASVARFRIRSWLNVGPGLYTSDAARGCFCAKALAGAAGRPWPAAYGKGNADGTRHVAPTGIDGQVRTADARVRLKKRYRTMET